MRKSYRKSMFLLLFMAIFFLSACTESASTGLEPTEKRETDNQEQSEVIEEERMPIEADAFVQLSDEQKKQYTEASPEEVIQNYVSSMNEKNVSAVLATLMPNSYEQDIEKAKAEFTSFELMDLELILNQKEENTEKKRHYLVRARMKDRLIPKENGAQTESNEPLEKVKETTTPSSFMKLFTLTKDNHRWVISGIQNVSSENFISKEMKKVEVKGLYLSAPTVNIDNRFDHFVQLLNETELNALVIDVKEDEGWVTFDSKVPLVNEIQADKDPYLPKLDERLTTLQENDIYSIARIVAFKDPYLAQKKTDLALKKKDGSLYYAHNIPWVDPYKKEVWDYQIAIAKEAAQKGFDEIQFDYVRFPENAAKYDPIVQFDNPEAKTKAEAVNEFLTYAKEQLRPYGVFVSADVFGIATSDPTDSGIGQQWETLNPTVDVLSPMVYPSHYAKGSFGIPVPDAEPYPLIKKSLNAAQERNLALKEKDPHTPIAEIRPWLQDFTATWVSGHIPYGPNQVKAQIQAASDLGINQYLIWSPSNNYSEGAWKE